MRDRNVCKDLCGHVSWQEIGTARCFAVNPYIRHEITTQSAQEVSAMQSQSISENQSTGTGGKRNGFIELCRFIFALCVVSHHALFLADPGYIPVVGGYISVEFFYILTGYFLFQSSQRAGDSRSGAIETAVARLKKVYPYFLVSWLASFLISHILNKSPLWTLLFDLLRGIPQLLLLSMAGLAGSSEGLWDYVGTGWYLSALLLTILAVYPLMRSWKTTFSSAIAPLVAILGYGYIMYEYNFLGVVNERLPMCYLGCIRSLAGICTGAFCYHIAQSIPKYTLSALGGVAVSLVQIGLLLVILYGMEYAGGFQDFIQVILFCALIIVSLSFKSYLNQLCSCNLSYFLGNFSMVVFVTQSLTYMYPILPYPQSWMWRYVAHFGYVLLFSLANYLLVFALKNWRAG